MSDKKIAIVSGASQGMGLSMLEELIKNNYFVVGFSRNKEKIEKISKEHYKNTSLRSIDVTDYKKLEEFSKHIHNKYGTPNLIINNASIINNRSKMWEIKEEEFKEVININLIGSFNVIKAFSQEMINSNNGNIINFSSYWGKYGEANLSPYCASKFAIEGLTKSLSKELPNQMSCISFDPGSTKTAMLKKCCPDSWEEAITPEVWAKIVIPYFINLNRKYNGISLNFNDLLKNNNLYS